MPIAPRLVVAALLVLVACKDDNGTGPSPSLAMTLTPASGTVVKGNSVQTVAVVTRSDYSGDLTFTVEGAPTGVTGNVGTSETTGDVTTVPVTLTTTTAAAAATVQLTVRAHGNGVTDVTKTYALTILPPASTNTVSINVSTCASKPIWLAAQDGGGTFARLLPTGDLYQFELTGARGTVAIVQSIGASYSVSTYTYDRAKWLGSTLALCTPPVVSMTGTFAGIPASSTGTLAFSTGAFGSRSSNGVVTAASVRLGASDLTAYLRGAAADGSGDRGIVRRGQNIIVAADVGTLDFTPGGESFAAVTAPITITGLVAGETPSLTMFHHSTVGGRCGTNSLYNRDFATASFPASGFPDDKQLPAEFHEAFVAGVDANSDYRGVGAVFHTMAAKTIALPSAIPAFTITSAGGLYRRLQTSSFVVPTDYAGEVFLQYFGGSRSVNIRVQTSTTAGQSLIVGLPDFSAVSGWDNSWAPSPSTGGQWFLNLYNDATGCVEGNRAIFSVKSGLY